jgi:hypothetical protein
LSFTQYPSIFQPQPGISSLKVGWSLQRRRGKALFNQVKKLNSSYPSGGLSAPSPIYAKKLLASSKAGEKPLEGYVPEVPGGSHPEPWTEEYDNYEKQGLEEGGWGIWVLCWWLGGWAMPGVQITSRLGSQRPPQSAAISSSTTATRSLNMQIRYAVSNQPQPLTLTL